MKTKWLRKTIADFDPYFVAPIAEKHVINANENYLNVLTIPGVKEELIQALDTFRPQVYPKPMSDDIRESAGGLHRREAGKLHRRQWRR